jgi:uncharacterized membrane protein YfcA
LKGQTSFPFSVAPQIILRLDEEFSPMESGISLLLSPLVSLEPHLMVVLMGIVFAGAFVTSGFGIGGGVLMTPLFIFFLPPKFGIGLLAPLLLLMSGTGVRQYWRQWDLHHVGVLLPAALVGVWLGSYLLAEISAEIVRKTVGVLAVAFGTIQLFTLARPAWGNRLCPTTWQGVCFGFASGITSALAHTGGIVSSFYLLPHSRTKEIFVSTSLFLFFTSGLVKVGTYWYYHILTLQILWISLALIPALILGSSAGKWLNRHISNKLFLRLISIFVAVMGMKLILG